MDVAILDDYQAVAEQMADWSQLPSGINVRFFHDHLADEDELVERLKKLPPNLLNLHLLKSPSLHLSLEFLRQKVREWDMQEQLYQAIKGQPSPRLTH